MNMDDTKPTNSSPSSRRVLLRPPSSTHPPTSSPPPPPNPPPDPSSHPPFPRLPQTPFSSTSSLSQLPSNGIVVVGFISRRHSDVSQLINRIIDSNVFGSGNRDKVLSLEGEELSDEGRKWFEGRKISYYLDDEKGVLYVQMCSTKCPAMGVGDSESNCRFDSAVEEFEFGDLQGLLFMFTVCHVIIYMEEGSRFHVDVLKKFRVLQSAKHALAPLVRSRNTLPSLSRPPSSPSCTSTPMTSSKSPPGRGGGIPSRNSSAISNMSAVGLYTSLFPGQCTPVTLFVFVDDFSDVISSSANAEDSTDAASSNQSSTLGSLGRSGLPVKGSGSVVVLARPLNKSEGGSRRKLQSSLEAQIRFLIKKCRTLSGFEISHAGSRNGAMSGSLPLLTLDSSRAVVLVDNSINQRGESLNFATDLLEDVLNGKATSDSLLLESHSQNGNKEEIVTLKEFIFRQADILRGRGGLVSNANSGSAAGVGMVAVAAAAAAAASAASRKIKSVPELPTLPIWLSSSQYILKGLLSAQRGCLDEIEISRRKFRQRNGVQLIEGAVSKGADPLDVAVSLLDTGKGINLKFSTMWCQKALPAAMEVYLKDLPAYYPTSQHEAHLEKALHAFHSMVKGTSVQQFMKKLEDECTTIWKSGRQLCDAISLTGKLCMHPRHDVQNDGLSSNVVRKPHSSGFVFLHACACGRSRRLRADPFDFETANVTFNYFPDCDKLIPTLQLPKVSDAGSIKSLISWHIVRVAGSSYYKPSKGLLQSGFCVNQKFLMKWTIVLEKGKTSKVPYAHSVQQNFKSGASADPNCESSAHLNTTKDVTAAVYPREVQTKVESQKIDVDYFKSEDKNINFGRGLPNIKMKKAFSEVVAGSVSANSEFPPLQKKLPSLGAEKGLKKSSVKDGSTEQTDVVSDNQRSEKPEGIPPAGQNPNGMSSVGSAGGNPFLQIGSNVVPLNLNDGGKIRVNCSVEHAVVYIGFEHECPHGHRYILSLDLLNEFGVPFSSPEESLVPHLVNNVDHKHRDPSKLPKSSAHSKVHLPPNDRSATMRKGINLEKSVEMVANGDQSLTGQLHLSEPGKEHYQDSMDTFLIRDSVKEFPASLESVNFDDGGHAFSMLNRNLPIYMNCPHCRVSKNSRDRQNTKFAGAISQLQRIFVVTPPFPVVVAMNPAVQFEGSCQPLNISNCGQQLEFGLGCQLILPPESFVSVRLPFVYGVQLENGGLHPLNPFEQQPEMTAWIKQGTTLQVMSNGSSLD